MEGQNQTGGIIKLSLDEPQISKQLFRVDMSITRPLLKQEALNLIRQALNSLIGVEKYLILQYGSSLFGSETKDSDFDLIILCAEQEINKYLSLSKKLGDSKARDSFFFGDFMGKLSSSNNLEMIKVFDVRHAKVPILKIKYRDQLSLDISLGLVSNPTIHGIPVSLLDPSDFETESVLQAVLICQEIQTKIQLAEIPNEVFSSFLYNIKLWAQQRKIYGQQYAFLGGIQWAILCSNLILQYSQNQEFQDLLYDKDRVVQFLLLKHFKFYSKWEWPNPINISSQASKDQAVPQFGKKGWNPISSVADSQHLMPIITPDLYVYKSGGSLSINTAECILQSSLQLYESEFERAYRIMRKCSKGKMNFPDDLMQPYECFIDQGYLIKADSGYHFVIVIQVLTQIDNNEICKYNHQKFLMTVESKVRSLLVNLDMILNPPKQSLGGKQEFQCLIRPYPKPRDLSEHDGKQCSEIYIGIKQIIEDKEMGVIDISPAIDRFADKIKLMISPICQDPENQIVQQVKIKVEKNYKQRLL